MIVRHLFHSDSDSAEDDSSDDDSDSSSMSVRDQLEEWSEPLGAKASEYLTLQYQLLKKTTDLAKYNTLKDQSSAFIRAMYKTFHQIQEIQQEISIAKQNLESDTIAYCELLKQADLESIESVKLFPSKDLWGDMMDLVQQKKEIIVGMAGLVQYLGNYTGGVLTLNTMIQKESCGNQAFHVYGRLNVQSITPDVHVILASEKGIPITSYLAPVMFSHRAVCPLSAFPEIATIACAGAIIFRIDDAYLTCIPNSNGDQVISEMVIEPNETLFKPITKTQYIETVVTALDTIEELPVMLPEDESVYDIDDFDPQTFSDAVKSLYTM